MERKCDHCAAQFDVTEADMAFFDTISPVFAGRKFPVPPPRRCPDCRFQRRLSQRNSSRLYSRKSDLSGKSIISIYAPDSPYTVYDQQEWWGDTWDAGTYGMEFDPNRPLFAQLQDLSLQVPRISLNTVNVENSYYTNHTLSCKNCYLLFGGGNDEDCYYGNYVAYSRDTMDALCAYHCEQCYEAVSSDHCYGCRYFMNCRNCTDCLFVESCQSCEQCVLCFGLQRKQYCYMNKEIGKEAMEKKLHELLPLTPEKVVALRKEFDAFKKDLPHRAALIAGSEGCTGDAIFNCSNCEDCFDVTDCEDGKFLACTPKGIRSYDCCYSAPDGVEYCYETCSTVGIQRAMGTFMAWYGSNVYYSMHCHSCNNVFACVGLRNKRHCILNRQYSPEEYGKTVAAIVEGMRAEGTWGEGLPADVSAFCYNETIAHEYYPLEKKDALAAGFRWRDMEPEVPQAEKVIPAGKLPGDIRDIPDDVQNWAILCEETGHPYKIMKKELELYRALQLPLPRLHPDVRHVRRLERRGPRRLWKRACGKCGGSVRTVYAPNRVQTVYCEECYLKEMY